MNTLLFKLGARNVLRQKRRSLFNILALGVNTGMVILLLGFIRGSYLVVIERTIDLRTGHIQIHRQGYEEERRRLPLDRTISPVEDVRQAVEAVPHVIAASPRIMAAAVVSNGRERAPVLLQGVIPSVERQVGVTLNEVAAGHTLEDTSRGILIGKRLAELLEADAGSPLVVYAQTKSHANNVIDADIAGIFNSGFPDADRGIIYMPLELARELLDMGDEATEFVIRLDKRRFVGFEVPNVAAAAATATADSLLVRPWYEIAADIVAGIKVDMISYFFIGLLLVVLAVFGITNTMTVSVYERTAEIGALRALGMEQRQIRKMLLAEGVVLGLAGTVIGALIGGALAWYLNVVGLPVPSEVATDISIPLPDRYYAYSRFVDWVFGMLLAILSALAGAWWPSRRAARVTVTAALAKGVR